MRMMSTAADERMPQQGYCRRQSNEHTLHRKSPANELTKIRLRPTETLCPL
jgi:hypothetical protein